MLRMERIELLNTSNGMTLFSCLEQLMKRETVETVGDILCSVHPVEGRSIERWLIVARDLVLPQPIELLSAVSRKEK